jgi:glycosyltransferase involved in cell wall biosynthesis
MTPSNVDKPGVYRLVYVGRSSAQIERDFGDRLSRLIREGFEVHALCGDDGGMDALAARGVVCKPIPVLNPRNPAGLLGAYFIVQAYFIEQRPVLVHAFDGPVAWLGALAAAAADVLVIVVSVDEHRLDAGLFQRLLKRLKANLSAKLPTKLSPRLDDLKDLSAHRALAGMVDKYFVSNERDLQALQDRELVPPSKLELIVGANGVDMTRFDVSADDFPTPAEAREALGLSHSWRDVLGYRGRLDGAKECADLVGCIEEVARTHPSAGWLLDVDASRLRGFSARRALAGLRAQERAGRVRIFDAAKVPEREATFYRALDLFVSPARRSGSPEPMMAAAAAEVGAVAYRQAASESVVEHGQTGELVEPGDVGGLIAAIRAALDDPQRRQAYGKRARSRAMRRFNRQHVEDQVFRIYDTVLEIKMTP